MIVSPPTWIRASIIVIGILSAVLAVASLAPLIQFISYEEFTEETWWPFLGATLAPIVLLFAAFLFVRYCDQIAVVVLKDTDSIVPYWERAAYRLAMFVCGVLVMSWALPTLGQIVHNWGMESWYPTADEAFRDEMQRTVWLMLTRMVFQTVLGAYLIIGAPHLVKWNIRRIEQLTERQTT